MSSVQLKPEVRIMLWTVPRSLATVLTKCMSYADGVQIIKEPFTIAYAFGPEGMMPSSVADDWSVTLDSANKDNPELPDLPKAFDDKDCTFDWAKKILEAEYADKQFVFCHDQAFCIYEKFDKIPEGYQHTFLIRHPHKVIRSWEGMVKNLSTFPWPQNEEESEIAFTTSLPAKRGYGEMDDLLVHLQKRGDEIIIIDADDLQQNPESILRQYCEAVKIPFNTSMLSWKPGNDILSTWIGSKKVLQGNQFRENGVFYEAFQSCQFNPPKPGPSRDKMPSYYLPLVDACMPIYDKMYEMRLRP